MAIVWEIFLNDSKCVCLTLHQINMFVNFDSHKAITALSISVAPANSTTSNDFSFENDRLPSSAQHFQ